MTRSMVDRCRGANRCGRWPGRCGWKMWEQLWFATGVGLSGILSERDLVEHVARGKDLDAVTAGEAMTSRMIPGKSSDTVHDAAYQILECGIRHVPVLSDTDELIGMVSIRDLLRPVLSDVGR